MRIELHVGQYLDLVCPASGAFDDPIIADIALFKTAETPWSAHSISVRH